MLWSAFYPDLLPVVPGCPDPLLEKQTRIAAIEFLRRTRAWVEWLDPVTSIEGLAEYDFDLPTGADVVRVVRATLDGNPIDVVSFRDAIYDPARQDMPDQGVVSRDLKTFRLGVSVAAGLPIQIQAAMVPSRNSTGIPDDLFEKYRDDIAHGALAKILALPEFFKPELLVLERGYFEAAINTCAVDAWRGHTGNTPRARLRMC